MASSIIRFLLFLLLLLIQSIAALASLASVTAAVPNKQQTTVSAYLGGGPVANRRNTTKAGAAQIDDGDDDINSRLADTPVAQYGVGATVTGAQVGSIAATGALAIGCVGG